MKIIIAISVYIVAICHLIGCKFAEQETYIIPSGFTGKVNIIFNQPGGSPIKYENGSRVYEIPSTGILLTQFKDLSGLNNRKYFYVEPNGTKRLLPIFDESAFKDSMAKPDPGKVGIFLDGTTGSYGNSGDPKQIQFQEFIVSDYKSQDDYFKSDYDKDFLNKLKAAVGHDF